MKKYIYPLFTLALMVYLLMPYKLFSQGDICEESDPFCTDDSYIFPAGVNSGSGQSGPYYQCLGSTPNPAWYHMRIQTGGDMTIKMYSEPSKDIDFICWGPFNDPTTPCNGQLTASKVVDCSFLTNTIEFCDITNAQVGEYYILLITNFSNSECNIHFEKTAGDAETDCSIVSSATNNGPICEGETLELYGNYIEGATYAWTGPNGFVSTLQNPVIYNATPANSGDYELVITYQGDVSSPSITTVVVQDSPTPYQLNGGGLYCIGLNAVPIGIDDSETGVVYKLFKNGNLVTTKNGTGSPLTFGTYTQIGTYTAIGISNNCEENMLGEAIITQSSMPVQYQVTGGGEVCEGDEGVEILLNDSEQGIIYQLLRDGNFVSEETGTGNALSFGNFSQTGTYTAKANNGDCESDMSGEAIVTYFPVSIAYNVTGGGNMCEGNDGLEIGLHDSESGKFYYLYLNGIETGDSVLGTGNPISFSLQTQTGTYTIKAENECGLQNMNGSVTITIVPYPLEYNVIGGGSFCEGSDGVMVGLDGSQLNHTYKLFRNGNFITIKNGTGSSLDFGLQTQPGVYTIQAISNQADCITDMQGSVEVEILELPNVNAGNNVTIPNGTSTTIDATVSGGTGEYNYAWEPQAYLIDPAVEDPTTVILSNTTIFNLIATDANTGCESTDEVTIYISGSGLGITAMASPSVICIGETTTLSPLPSGGSGNYVSYEWTDNNGFTSDLENPVVSPEQTTTYYVSVFDGYTTANGQVTVTVNPKPEFYLENTSTLYETATQLFCDIQNPDDYTFYWEPVNLIEEEQNTLQNPMTTLLTNTQTYELTVTNMSTGCQETKNVAVQIFGGQLLCYPYSSANEICLGAEIQLFAGAQGGDSLFYSYQWTDNQGFESSMQNPAYMPTNLGLNQVFLTLSDGVHNFTNSTSFIVNNNPHVELEPLNSTSIGQDSIVVCLFDTILIDAGNEGSTYLWNNGFDEQNFEIYTLGVGYDSRYYIVNVTNQDGCSSSDSIFIVFDYNECGVGYDENGKEYTVKIFPNPLQSGTLYMQTTGIKKDLEVQLINMDGQLLQNKKVAYSENEIMNFSMDMHQHIAGVYVVRLVFGNTVHEEKIILIR